MGGRVGRGLWAVWLLPALVSCADTAQPVLGGLRVGVAGGAFQMPMMLNDTLPFQYPAEAWAQRIGGETLLYMHISREGAVDSVMVMRSSGNRSLDSAALAGAHRLRFRPARQGPDGVDVWAKLPVRFPVPSAVRSP